VDLGEALRDALLAAPVQAVGRDRRPGGGTGTDAHDGVVLAADGHVARGAPGCEPADRPATEAGRRLVVDAVVVVRAVADDRVGRARGGDRGRGGSDDEGVVTRAAVEGGGQGTGTDQGVVALLAVEVVAAARGRVHDPCGR